MAQYKITNIIDPEAKTGEGAKGAWSMSLVELDNGKQVRIFNPVQVGDLVEAYKNGEYWNYRLAKTQQTSMPVGDDKVLKVVMAIYKDVQVLKRAVLGLDAEIAEEAPKPQPTAPTKPKEDAVVEPNDDIDFDLMLKEAGIE